MSLCYPMVVPRAAGYDNLTNWPDLTNRPTFSGSTLSWIGPVDGGDSTSSDVQQTQVLTNSGGITTSSNNQVITGLNISGGVTVNGHTGVTIKRCRLFGSHQTQIILLFSGSTGLQVVDCEIDGGGSTGYGVNNRSGGSDATYLRCNIHGCENGIDPGNDDTVRDCYIWDLDNTDGGDPHYDGIEFDGGSGLTVEHNQIWNDHSQTSCCMIDNFFAPVDNVLINNNRMIGISGYQQWMDGRFAGGAMTNITWSNNKVQEGEFGYYSFEMGASGPPTHTGNVDWITFASID